MAIIRPALDALHIPVITAITGGEWGVYCHACSQQKNDYVPRCLLNPGQWPPLTLRATLDNPRTPDMGRNAYNNPGAGHYRRLMIEAIERAEQAEAALSRVRALAQIWESITAEACYGDEEHADLMRGAGRAILAALAQPKEDQ